MITFDTETCGLHGLATTIQYAEGMDGPIKLHEIWKEPIYETLEIIHKLINTDWVMGFNLAFDWFHVCKLWTTFSKFHNFNECPEDHIEDLAFLEEQARFSDVCLKPKSACDIMLWARKGKYQSLMAREDIKLRRVPTPIAYKLANHLEKAIQFDQIYFARRKDKFAPNWKVYDIKKNGRNDPDFKDIKLKFRSGSGLKHLARHALGANVVFHKDIEVPREYWPVELGYAPYALANATRLPSGTVSWNRSWPDVIREHILHWRVHERARQYAVDDVDYTRRLHPVVGNPEPGDDDSVLACMVGGSRWRGYSVNLGALAKVKLEAEDRIKKKPIAPKPARIYLEQVMDDMEKIVFSDRGTRKAVLEEIAKWESDPIEDQIDTEPKSHPAATRAKEILSARKAKKEIELYKKLLHARRFHASFTVIGSLSNRMAGADKLNPQGIHHLKHIRACFTLADQTGKAYSDWSGTPIKVPVLAYVLDEKGFPQWLPAEIVDYIKTNQVDTALTELDGGDFQSFEVGLAAAVFSDENLTRDLQSGKKIHALFAVQLFPGKTYEEILKSAGKDPDYYDTGKKGIFTLFYGGDPNTLKNKYGIALEIGEAAYQGFTKQYPKVGKERAKITEMFCSMRQIGGIGSRIEWREPADYVESFLGFRRYFTLENRICKTLFKLAENPPEEFKRIKIKVQRRDRIQTACGATQSAIFASAFGIQSANTRAALNHLIQSPGGTITKALQRSIWDVQPSGIGEWLVQPFNCHDEIMNPTKPKIREQVKINIDKTINHYKQRIPLLAIDWKTNISSWAGK